MADPAFDGERAVMFVCGDDDTHKPTVLKLAADIGFEAIDAGSLVIARLLEPYGMLWIHLALARGLGRPAPAREGGIVNIGIVGSGNMGASMQRPCR